MHTLPYAPGCQCKWHGGTPPAWQSKFSGKQVRLARMVAWQLAVAHAVGQWARLALLLYRHPRMPSPEAERRLDQSAGWVYQWRRF